MVNPKADVMSILKLFLMIAVVIVLFILTP